MKRFTASEKWSKEWFQMLPPRLKCFWNYLCENCDAAGVWEPNFGLASYLIGEAVCETDLGHFGDRIAKLSGGKFHIVSFIEFQYGQLSPDCKAHLPVFRLLKKHGLSAIEVPDASRVGRVSETKRTATFVRDGRRCIYCQSEESLEPDHLLPRSKGGSDDLENLVTACHVCNSRRGEQSVRAFAATLSDQEGFWDRLSNRVSSRLFNSLQEKDTEKEKEKGSAEGVEPQPRPILPTLDQAGEAAPACGIDRKAAETWWHECDGRGLSPRGYFLDAKGAEIRNWRSAMTSYGLKWQSNLAERASRRGKPHASTEAVKVSL